MKGVLYDGQELSVTDRLEITDPDPDQVVVRIHAAGVCHSDLSMINGTVGGMIPAPFILGHEGAGVVEAVGSQVRSLRAGDHVVLTTIDNCGRCDVCAAGHPTLCQNSKLAQVLARNARSNRTTEYHELPAYFRLDGKPIIGMANTGVFAERVVVGEGQAIAIDKSVPFTSACLIGCAVLTGAGAVFNRAKVYRGDTVAVIGVGGIGISCIQAARIAGATKIIAIDTLASKEAMAQQFGATHFVNARESDAVTEVLALTGGGVNYSFECVGAAPTMQAAIDMLGPGGINRHPWCRRTRPHYSGGALQAVPEQVDSRLPLRCRSSRGRHPRPRGVLLAETSAARRDGRARCIRSTTWPGPSTILNQAASPAAS